MKKIKFLLVAILFVAGISANAQWSLNGTHAYSTATGNVGIGNGSSFTPTYLLHVAKNMTEPTITVNNLGGMGGASFAMIDNRTGNSWKFKSYYLSGKGGFKIRDQQYSLDVVTIENNALANAIYVKSGGYVGIGGVTAPKEALEVNGNVRCNSIIANGKITTKEVEVTIAASAFPDYVFAEDYSLKPLSEVEKFIKENKHLPGVPNAKEVANNGLSLGAMNVKLVEKVEELTLYVIQLQKEIDALKSKQ